MPRKFHGAHETSIPIDAILEECAAWADEIVEATGDEVLKETRKRAGTAFWDDSGELRKHIKKKKSVLDKDTHIVGAFWPNAHLVELGTDLRVNKQGKSSGHMPASPFLGPAAEAVKERLPDIVNNVVGVPTIEVKK